MDIRQLDAWVQRANSIKNCIIYASLLDMRHKHICIDSNMFIINEGVDMYNQLLSQIFQKTKCGTKLTRGSVDKRFKGIIYRSLIGGASDNFTTDFGQFIAEIENYNIEQAIYLPLDNIEMQDLDRIRFGNISLVKMNEKQIAILSEKVKETISQTTHKAEDKPMITKTFLQYNVEPLRGRVCVEYRCIAEPDLAEARAHKAALSLIDILRYAIPKIYSNLYPACFFPNQALRDKRKEQSKKSSYRTRTRIGIGLQGEVPVGLRNVCIFPSTNVGFELHSSFVGMRPFVINPDHVALMKKQGIFRLALLSQKRAEELTSLEDVLMRSIHWFANAQLQLEIEDELLNLVTSLETLLTNKTNPLMDSVSYGIAFILGNSVTEREVLIKRYKEIYDERSATSHHGMRNADEVDLIELRFMAQEVLHFLIIKLKKWTTQEQILEWVKIKKLQ